MRAAVLRIGFTVWALLAASPQAGAEPFLYEFTGLGTGTLDGSPFPLQGFQIALRADTGDVTTNGELRIVPASAATFALDVSGAGQITTPVFVNVNQSTGAIVFSDTGLAIFFFYDAAFGSYELDAPLGPIESMSVGLQEIPLATSAGTLVFTAVSSLAFEAPEPAAFASGAAALAALSACSRRSRPQPR